MMNFTKRGLLGAALGLAMTAAGGLPPVQAADGYPSGPITMLVGYGAGGQTDLVARAAAQVMSGELGEPINVVNMPGAGGSLAAHQLLKAAPDGQTILFHSDSVVNSAPFIIERVNFKPDDFEYAGMITAYQVGLATHKDAPFDTLPEYIAWAREHPGSSYGALSPEARMYINAIAEKEGLDVNIVPLKSGGEMLNALLGRQVELAFSGGIHFRNPDELKTISALTTFRQPSAPDVATIEEDGFPLGMDSRTTLFLPKGTPRDILDKLAAALKAAETDENFVKITESANIPIMYLGVDEAYAEIDATYEKHKKILKN
ncbi:Bug family tripartite tricarboxylate transporter substrate binding protein [Roseibium marinum]|uniref:Tripartite-type tricarboxylate transporter receptor subunit TctC n=1 Tax=Roseibium marinum TaxID=281252 RepID=A0A2S3V4L3_9HYPH|nr:tripartite tricarboxylate transporter substrate binding protein [Roseibium marinum]POF34901.1 tripartite-type tricarboxylate transporter receptor subunit TctC [Roseibium marinum]